MLQDTGLFSEMQTCEVSDSVHYIPENHIAHLDLHLVQVCLKDTQANLRCAGCHQYKFRPAVAQQNTRVAQRGYVHCSSNTDLVSAGRLNTAGGQTCGSTLKTEINLNYI
jgi:hypothetical protein